MGKSPYLIRDAEHRREQAYDPELAEPWDRLPQETDAQWACFQHYMRTPRHLRSVARTYREMYNKGEGKSAPGRFSTMATRNRWVERARAWDEYQDQLQREAEEEERRQWREYRRQLLAATFSKAVAYLDGLDPEKNPAGLSAVTRMVQTVLDELRNEYESKVTSQGDGSMPTIVFTNVSLAQYEERAQELVEEGNFRVLLEEVGGE